MAEWSVKPIWKKSIIEKNYYHKDGQQVVIETGWRWGEFTVYTDDDNPPNIEAGVDIYEVVTAIRMRPTHKNIMLPGLGVGGYCLTKDPLLASWAKGLKEAGQGSFCRMK